MEDVSIGHVHQIQSDVRERQIWLWHRRLWHPNFGYLKHLRPDFFFLIRGYLTLNVIPAL